MAFPGDYTLLRKIPIDAAAVTGSNDDFTGAITEAAFKLSKTFIFANTDNGGGDVRFSTDEAGTNQIPIEIVSWDTSGETCVLRYLADGVDDVSPTDLYIWGDNTGDSQPAVGAAFGRNAVWALDLNVYHGDSLTDSAGNNDLTNNGGTTLGAVGKIGGAFSFDGTDDSLSVSSYSPVTGSGDRSIRGWLKTPATTDKNIVEWGPTGISGALWVLRTDLASGNWVLRTEVNGGSKVASTSLNNDVYRHFAQTFSGTNATDINHYLDGTLESVSSSASQSINTGTDALIIGARASSRFFNGEMNLLVISGRNLSADYIATEQSNQNDVASFYLEPVAPAGGITLTGTAVPTQTEADIVTGGKTIILTLAGDTFVTGSSSEDGIAGGSDSDIAASGTNWDSLIKTDLDNTNVVLSVGDTVATITLPAYASYDIPATETITWTIPAASLTTSAIDIIGTPTHTVTPTAAGGTISPYFYTNLLAS